MTNFHHYHYSQLTENMTLLISVAVALFLPNVGGLPPAGARIPGEMMENNDDGDDYVMDRQGALKNCEI